MTQRELADALNVSSSEVVSRWERGEREPRIEMLHAIASVLGVAVGDLVGGATPPWMNDVMWGSTSGSKTLVGTVQTSPMSVEQSRTSDTDQQAVASLHRSTRIPNPGSPPLRVNSERTLLDQLLRQLEATTPVIRDAVCRVALSTLAELETLRGDKRDP